MIDADQIPAGWGWHPACTVSDVQARHEAMALTVDQRRSESRSAWHGRELPETIQRRIRAMAEGGAEFKEIARSFGLSTKTIYRHTRPRSAA